jgi:invasion protein IalB
MTGSSSFAPSPSQLLTVLATAALIYAMPAAAQQSCTGDVCGDLRPVLNPPFPMAPADMFYPAAQMQDAPRSMMQLASVAGRSAGRLPQLRQGFTPVQQRGPAAAPPPAPAAQAPRAQAPAAQAPAAQAPPAPASDQRGVNAWFAECPQGQTTGCTVFRRGAGPNGAAGITIIVGPDQRQPGRNQATIVLPLGIAVRESVPLLIDERFIALMPIETCLPAGCVVTLALSPPMVAALRGATTIKLLALAPNGQTLPYSVEVGGFGEAYQKVAG